MIIREFNCPECPTASPRVTGGATGVGRVVCHGRSMGSCPRCGARYRASDRRIVRVKVTSVKVDVDEYTQGGVRS